MLYLMRASWRDLWRLYRWRNDAATRQQMYSLRPLTRWEHVRWFWRAMRSDDAHVYVAVVTGVGPVGTIRWRGRSAQRYYADCSVVVDAAYRGRGYATEMIRQMTQIAAGQDYRMMMAEVRVANAPSRRAFARAGFVRQFETSETVTMTRDLTQ